MCYNNLQGSQPCRHSAAKPFMFALLHHHTSSMLLHASVSLLLLNIVYFNQALCMVATWKVNLIQLWCTHRIILLMNPQETFTNIEVLLHAGNVYKDMLAKPFPHHLCRRVEKLFGTYQFPHQRALAGYPESFLMNIQKQWPGCSFLYARNCSAVKSVVLRMQYTTCDMSRNSLDSSKHAQQQFNRRK